MLLIFLAAVDISVFVDGGFGDLGRCADII